MRLFFGVDLPWSIKHIVESYQREIGAKLASDGKRIRWRAMEGLHLTVAFLGDQDPPQLSQLFDVAMQVSCQVAGFTMRFGSIGGFPTNESARVLWLGVEATVMLHQLQQSLCQELSQREIHYDKRPFVPHLTLARCPSPLDISLVLPETFWQEFMVDELTLFESRPDLPTGHYAKVRNFPLQRAER